MNNKKVIIFENNHDSSKDLKRSLESLSYHIIDVARSRDEVFEKTRKHYPDLVFFDLNDLQEHERDAIKTKLNVPVLFFGQEDNYFGEDFVLSSTSSEHVALLSDYAIKQMQLQEKASRDTRNRSIILNQLNEGVVQLSISAEIVDLNVSAELLMGCIKEHVVGRPIGKVLELCERKSKQKIDLDDFYLFKETLKNQTPFVCRSFRGLERLVDVRLIELDKNPQREAPRWALLLEDVTRLHSLEKGFGVVASALEYIDVPVLITNANVDVGYPDIVYVNKAFQKFTGYSDRELVEKPIKILFPKESKKSIGELLYNAAKMLKFMTDETIIRNKSGDRLDVYYNTFCVCDAGNEPTYLVSFLHDVTQLRKLEENIRQSQKVEGVGRFTGGIAHDFNNLLSVINSYSDLLALKIKDNNTLQSYVSNIRMAGARGANLVSQLMAFSRREVCEPKPIQLGLVVQDMQDMMERLISEDICIRVEIAEDVGLIYADLSQVEQIIVNLCVNARDAIEDKGCIMLSVCAVCITAQSPMFEKQGFPVGDYVLLSVSDDGCGMDFETQRKIFEPFFTTKDIGKGTGLGLATVYGIIKKMNGFIHLESEVGKGTTFNIYFPTYNDNTRENFQNHGAKLKKSTEKILILDDEDVFTDCLKALFTLNGFDAASIPSVEFDLKSISKDVESYDLLIVDSGYSQGRGFEIAKDLIKIHTSAEIIFLVTNEHEVEHAQKVLFSPKIMLKPFPLNAILKETQSVLNPEDIIKGKQSNN